MSSLDWDQQLPIHSFHSSPNGSPYMYQGHPQSYPTPPLQHTTHTQPSTPSTVEFDISPPSHGQRIDPVQAYYLDGPPDLSLAPNPPQHHPQQAIIAPHNFDFTIQEGFGTFPHSQFEYAYPPAGGPAYPESHHHLNLQYPPPQGYEYDHLAAYDSGKSALGLGLEPFHPQVPSHHHLSSHGPDLNMLHVDPSATTPSSSSSAPSSPHSSASKKRKRNSFDASPYSLPHPSQSIAYTSAADAKPTHTLRRRCFNCAAHKDVAAWRRSVIAPGQMVCNRCGLYEKAHGRIRPVDRTTGALVRTASGHHPRPASVHKKGASNKGIAQERVMTPPA